MNTSNQDQGSGIPAVGGEFRNLKQHGSATIVELREFVAQMRGKSPREMLGAVAESGLVRATIQATIGCVILIGVFTVGPYYVGGGKAEAKSAGPGAPAKSDSSAQSPHKNDAADESGSSNSSTDIPGKSTTAKNGELPGPADMEKAAKKLGIGETKSADPKVNPLDKDLDFLLDKK